jgi:hypothetical protein
MEIADSPIYRSYPVDVIANFDSFVRFAHLILLDNPLSAVVIPTKTGKIHLSPFAKISDSENLQSGLYACWSAAATERDLPAIGFTCGPSWLEVLPVGMRASYS